MGTGDSSDMAMKGKEKGLREEGKVDNDQIALEGRGPDHLDHHPLGSVLAKQELCVSADGGQGLQLCDVLEGDGVRRTHWRQLFCTITITICPGRIDSSPSSW